MNIILTNGVATFADILHFNIDTNTEVARTLTGEVVQDRPDCSEAGTHTYIYIYTRSRLYWWGRGRVIFPG